MIASIFAPDTATLLVILLVCLLACFICYPPDQCDEPEDAPPKKTGLQKGWVA
jgi:hypothetical protein